MTTLTLLLITLSVLAVAVALISMLLAIKRLALRAEALLLLLEQEIRPMAGQLQSLVEDLRAFSRHAGRDLDRVGAAAARLDDVCARIGRLVGVVGGMTRVGQFVGAAAGIKKGLDVFLARLVSKNRDH